MKSPLEDTIWGASYGSTAAVRAAFAAALRPHLDEEAQGLDLGCGSGVLGLALRERGLRQPLDGLDLSPGMLELARATGCYRQLLMANLLEPEAPAAMPDGRYDFVVTVGLIGDYVPYYVGLPFAVARLRPGGVLGFAVEIRSTPWPALAEAMRDLRLESLSETVLAVPPGELMAQTYHFFVARLG